MKIFESRNLLSSLFVAGILLSACNKKPEIENTSTVRMAGEWWTEYSVDGDVLTDHHKIITYNTSDPSSNKLWIEDQDIWPFKSKATIDYGARTFIESTDVNELIDAETVKFYEGKVITGGGRSKSGVVVDSIYLKVEFSDDPGVIYEIKGHQRTGFFEDEYQ